MFEWILLFSQLIVFAAIIQLYRLRRCDAQADEDYRSIQLDTDAGGQGTPDSLERLAARLDQVIDRIDAEAGANVAGDAPSAQGSGVRGRRSDLALQTPDPRPQAPGGALSPTEEVVRLQRSGLTVKEIAQRTGRGQQEIELALGLQRPRKRSAS